MSEYAAAAEIRREPISALAQSVLPVFEPQDVYLPNVCVYENVHEFSEGFAEHLWRDIYIARTVHFPRVDLVTLPPGTTVHGDYGYITTVGDMFVNEQFHSTWHPPKAPEVLASATPEIHVPGDALLLARFGATTWGHWLGELVPRAVVAELVSPGKYNFIIPNELGARTSNNFLQALYAYGISDDRLIRIDQEHRYVFDRLATVSSMWIYPYAMQPTALALMRNNIKVSIPAMPGDTSAVAMLRPSSGVRYIENHDEIRSFLRIKKFLAVDIGSMPFVEQVALFQKAHTVFGELGSNLTGLIYSPLGVRMVSVAPGDWGDCFFHGLVQAQAGKYADVRGTPNPAAENPHFAPFMPSIVRVTEALEALGHT
ncbi:MAG: glycosyltransferase family 61 protein [Acidocella sp.]|uniref:glycosyltransferase family 61 protein n=1 Tax=Acidocella sp. TaxID=50710 RepID=UPI003FC7E30D